MLRRASEVLRAATRVVVFTGAGISAESGVPTFRDDLTGLWARYDPQRLATPEAFQADPDLVWGWYEWRRARVRRAVPNDGHRAVAAIESRAPQSTLITQNVDDLHERAGSADPIHPAQALAAAIGAASTCDVLLTVGTSGVVYPAAEIPMVAARRGAAVIQVNPQSTPLDAVATVNLRGTAAALLPELVTAAWPDR